MRRGCIFETLYLANDPWASTGLHAFASMRSDPPCTLKACQLLFSAKIVELVVALLGPYACLLNDQVRHMPMAAQWLLFQCPFPDGTLML